MELQKGWPPDPWPLLPNSIVRKYHLQFVCLSFKLFVCRKSCPCTILHSSLRPFAQYGETRWNVLDVQILQTVSKGAALVKSVYLTALRTWYVHPSRSQSASMCCLRRKRWLPSAYTLPLTWLRSRNNKTSTHVLSLYVLEMIKARCILESTSSPETRCRERSASVLNRSSWPRLIVLCAPRRPAPICHALPCATLRTWIPSQYALKCPVEWHHKGHMSVTEKL